MSKTQEINDTFTKFLLNLIQEENIDMMRELLENKNLIKLEEINEVSDLYKPSLSFTHYFCQDFQHCVQ